ncbi:MAG: hypothetical protein AMXMBFR83_12490 [Phycisphaerae bacterium]
MRGGLALAGGRPCPSFSGGKLVVEKTRFPRNDKEVAIIPDAATKVHVDYSNGTVKVAGDGVEGYEPGGGN